MFYAQFESSGRLDLTPKIVLGELVAREAERIRQSLSYEDPLMPAPLFRLEIHDFDVPDDWQSSQKPAREAVTHAMALLAVAAGVVPMWLNISMDEFSANEWKRWNSVYDARGGTKLTGYPQFYRVSLEEVELWGKLLQNFPHPGAHRRLDVALDYFYESVVDLVAGQPAYGNSVEPRKAFLSAAIALEALFSDHSPGISHRIAQRGAQLVSQGERAVNVCKQLKDYYDSRSRLMHEGTVPQGGLVWVHRFLRKALPTMAALLDKVGTHGEVLEILDNAAFVRDANLDNSLQPDQWWSFIKEFE